MNYRLYGSRVYLCGAMDKAQNNGEGWRNALTPFLEKLGIVIFNPCDKPIQEARETPDDRVIRDGLLNENDYDTVVEQVKVIRHVDLRMVDASDFLIVYLDLDILMCGTWEELFWANRMKRPVLVVCRQGKLNIPHWLFGTIPHDHIFNDFDELKQYLVHVHHDKHINTYNRWVFFDPDKLVPKCPKVQVDFAA